MPHTIKNILSKGYCKRYFKEYFKECFKGYLAVVNFLIPHTCLKCQTPVYSYGLCTTCFCSMVTITPPFCHGCGMPFAKHTFGKLCAKCIQRPPHCTVRSAVAYNEGSRSLLLHLKHADGQHLAPFMANRMVEAAKDSIGGAHMMLPVPLHRKRLVKRQYNQSCLLATHMAKQGKIPVYVDILLRTKNTQSQGKKTVKERQQNVKGAFSVQHKNRIQDKCIVLVDDVVTSGSTINECARTLLKAGAQRVLAITYARVTDPL